MTANARFGRRGTLLMGALLAGLFGSGCPPGENGTDALPPDICNSLDEALNDARCAIQQGEPGHLDFINPTVSPTPPDQDWFSLRTPATMDARSLLRVTAGYGVPATPVQLSLNLLREDGAVSLGRVVDLHGQGAPRSLEILNRFTEPGARLVMLLGDQPDSPARPQSDPRNPYLVKWDVLQDPDANEPNDTTPTPIALDGSLSGTATGVLATPDDQDRFSIDAPGGGRILYLHVGEASPSPKPANYRLAYTLYSPPEAGFPDGRPVAEGRVDNEFSEVDLATARLLPAAGSYTLVIHAYRAPGVLGPLPGDERLTYRIDVLIVDQQDGNEPNDTLAQAQAVTLVVGAPRTFTGRIGSVGDPDWFALDLPADTQPRVLRYRLLPPSGTGRFPPLPLGPGGLPDRELYVVTEVPAGTAACRTDSSACPKGYAANPNYQLPVEQICGRTPAQCLWSDRNEDFSYPNLRNFEGRIPVAPHGTTARYYVVFQDVGNDWADDRDYTLQVTLEADPDEAARASLPGETEVAALAEDVSGSTFPVPPAGATVLSGTLSHGYGRLFENEPTSGEGIRGPADYDAVASDVDRYQLDLPFIDPSSGPLDRTWELQWSVQDTDGGGRPLDLFLEVEFCDGTQTPTDGGSCYSVTRSRRGGALAFTYESAGRQSWWNAGLGIPLQPLYDLDTSGPSTTVTTRAYSCFCFEPRFVQGGRFYLKVGAVDRNTWDVAQYTVRTAFTSYPQAFQAFSDGGTRTCPPVNDAGTSMPPDGGSDGGMDDGGTIGAPDAGPRGGCDFTR